MAYIRECPDCKIEIPYKEKRRYIQAISSNTKCRSCAKKIQKQEYPIFRDCPKCGSQISYSCKYQYNKSVKRATVCKACVAAGTSNGFYGKKHSDETKKKIRNTRLSNGYGSLMNVLVSKYGEEEGLRRFNNSRQKVIDRISKRISDGNYKLGKSIGWSGRYNGIYFRSLCELKFILDCENAGIEVSSAESLKYSVRYTKPDGVVGTYFPDFICGNTIYEIKPKKFQSSEENILKSNAAIEYYNSIGMNYLMIDPGKLSLRKLKELVLSDLVSLDDRISKSFAKFYAGIINNQD